MLRLISVWSFKIKISIILRLKFIIGISIEVSTKYANSNKSRNKVTKINDWTGDAVRCEGSIGFASKSSKFLVMQSTVKAVLRLSERHRWSRWWSQHLRQHRCFFEVIDGARNAVRLECIFEVATKSTMVSDTINSKDSIGVAMKSLMESLSD
jgi:hypothetical protein